MHALAFIGGSGSGKTTILERLVPALARRSLTVGIVKHTHHDVELDRPGKDSWRLREAGAKRVVLSSDRWIFITEPAPERIEALELVRRAAEGVDLVLVEGFSRLPLPTIEVWRAAVAPRPRLDAGDPRCLALASDDDPGAEWQSVQRFGLGEVDRLAEAIMGWRATNRLRA